MSENTSPPAGWHADPQHPSQQRYWDGTAWTEHVAPAATADPGAVPATAAPYTLPTKKGLSTGAIIAIVVGGMVLLGLLIVGLLAAAAGPVFNSQRAQAHDAAAKADVSTLGLELATYYVDHDGPPPAIVVENGNYAFADGTPTWAPAEKSPEVELGGQTGTGWDNWCVWVTAPEGELKDFQYSAQSGLEQGRC